jgi:hypothetical protein
MGSNVRFFVFKIIHAALQPTQTERQRHPTVWPVERVVIQYRVFPMFCILLLAEEKGRTYLNYGLRWNRPCRWTCNALVSILTTT